MALTYLPTLFIPFSACGSTPFMFMVFGVTYANCEGLKRDAWRFQSVMFVDCKYDVIGQHKRPL